MVNVRFFYDHRLLSLLILCFAALFATRAVGAAPLPLRANIIPNCTPVSGNTNWRFADIWADGNIAVQGSYNCRGVFIYDLTDPDNPVLASHYNPSPNQAFLEAVVVGNRGYFGSGGTYPAGTASAGDGVHIVDLSNPYQPVLIGKVNESSGSGYNGVHEMVVHGNFLIENFNSTSNKVIRIIDVSNPASPVLKWQFSPLDDLWVHAVHTRGNRMYTSGWRGKIEIYDISNLAAQPPVLLGTIIGDNNNHTSWTSEDGKYLYSARETSDGDIRVYDVSNPAEPLLVKATKTSDLGLDAISPHNPVVMGDKLYVSWYQAGLQVFDLSVPTDPVHISGYDTSNLSYDPQPQTASLALNSEPWDLICGGDNLLNVPSSYDGAWAVYPLLGTDKVLVGDMKNGLFIVDASGLSAGPAVSLSGRVLTPDGGGLRNAVVTITGPNGFRMSVPTSSLGYYQFDDLPEGSYTVAVSSRRYRFEARPVTLSDSLSAFDFVGME